MRSDRILGIQNAAIRLEQRWNELAKKYSFSLRCGYSMASCCGESNIQPLNRVCVEHSAVMLEEEARQLSADDPLLGR